MKKLLFTLCFVWSVFTGFAQHTRKTIVLVPGIYSTAVIWDKVIPLLKAKGYEVIAITFPGHGDDHADLSTLTMATYASSVEKAIGKRKSIVLVGHSMGGMVISQVAEDIPGQIGKLVYLAAYIPKNGESMFTKVGQSPKNGSANYFSVDTLHGILKMDTSKVWPLFAADSPHPWISAVVRQQKYEEPIRPLISPVALTDAKFGKVKKSYIFTTADSAILYPFQRKMVHEGRINETYLINSSHTPMFSQPERLAEIIEMEAR
ncbi:alpha/beta fold hydrolase [Mucilaginibacter agri]|uniref:Alpha/beta fold hydrolase n=1 Tax=Mucilaginibacter agri TaxID=2695265 RepID=A0A965ZBK0_9SPHI|nr:alpha/beta hydrolase [Mucilaginibacter agri]NCD67755.1 alpha/beta fold hydrolase [Mucilaginibacter agri]